jgi:UDPglucose--hexose-1-phosphate uridylyltransferase
LPQLRQNIITGDWVVIAPERAKRPVDYIIPPMPPVMDKSNCPFCEGTKGYKENKKVLRASSEHLYVINNKFPAFVESGKAASVRSYYPEKGFYRAREATGDHDVIVIRDHDTSLPHFSKSLMAEIIEAFCDRYNAMKKEPGVASIMPIYNHRPEAGASIAHPHAQVFASGIVANTVGREMSGAERYFGINGACVFCDIIKHEIREKVRVVVKNNNFLSATFYAARFPMETWIYPLDHRSQFEDMPKSHIDDLADALMETIERMSRAIPHLPLNFYIHTLPTTHKSSSSYHWHLEITPRLANYGGYELGSGVIIDIMSPEDAAEYLKRSKSKDS